MTLLQRFGDTLNTNVHFHTLVLDGVYEGHPSWRLSFHELESPGTEEVEWVARRVARQLVRLLQRRGPHDTADISETDVFSEDEPLLAALYSASVRGKIAMGPRAGQRVLRLGVRIYGNDLSKATQKRCVDVGGISLHVPSWYNRPHT